MIRPAECLASWSVCEPSGCGWASRPLPLPHPRAEPEMAVCLWQTRPSRQGGLVHVAPRPVRNCRVVNPNRHLQRLPEKQRGGLSLSRLGLPGTALRKPASRYRVGGTLFSSPYSIAPGPGVNTPFLRWRRPLGPPSLHPTLAWRKHEGRGTASTVILIGSARPLYPRSCCRSPFRIPLQA